MKESRSAGSTSAPHFVILSTSFVHAPLLSRCCTMMPASWHSVHAVRTFARGGPPRHSGEWARSNGSRPIRGIAKTRPTCVNVLSLDIDLHLVNGVVHV